MGALMYGSPEHVFILDDRALAHLQIVIIKKLRYNEHFAFTCSDAEGPTTFWMSPSIPLRFEFLDGAEIEINRDWLLALERAAGTVQGLRMVDEPIVQRLQPTRELVGVRA